jgi:hypothetical protein
VRLVELEASNPKSFLLEGTILAFYSYTVELRDEYFLFSSRVQQYHPVGIMELVA